MRTQNNKSLNLFLRNNSLRFALSKSRFNAKTIFAMISVKGGRPLLGHLIRSLYVVVGNVTPNWVRICKFFLADMHRLKKAGGPVLVVKYLKTCSVILQQVVSGYKIPDLTPLGLRVSRSKSGLPRIIPSYHRKLIMRRNKLVIRF